MKISHILAALPVLLAPVTGLADKADTAGLITRAVRDLGREMSRQMDKKIGKAAEDAIAGTGPRPDTKLNPNACPVASNQHSNFQP